MCTIGLAQSGDAPDGSQNSFGSLTIAAFSDQSTLASASYGTFKNLTNDRWSDNRFSGRRSLCSALAGFSNPGDIRQRHATVNGGTPQDLPVNLDQLRNGDGFLIRQPADAGIPVWDLSRYRSHRRHTSSYPRRLITLLTPTQAMLQTGCCKLQCPQGLKFERELLTFEFQSICAPSGIDLRIRLLIGGGTSQGCGFLSPSLQRAARSTLAAPPDNLQLGAQLATRSNRHGRGHVLTATDFDVRTDGSYHHDRRTRPSTWAMMLVGFVARIPRPPKDWGCGWLVVRSRRCPPKGRQPAKWQMESDSIRPFNPARNDSSMMVEPIPFPRLFRSTMSCRAAPHVGTSRPPC